MNIEEVKQEFEKAGYETWITERVAGVRNKVARKTLWIKVDKEKFREAMQFFKEIADQYPHFSIISCTDLENIIELNYHFALGYGRRLEEYVITFKVNLPKNDLKIDSIADIFPAVIYSEREIQEMMGIEVINIPDGRHMFLTKDFPSGVYPWRRDEAGVKETNKLYERWKDEA
ncbi:MAG: NADH-quinone oxidoreductase subunit C [Thermoplasmata archaeon]|nr:MAG: NADH-quinone oxidoreductase subunit C [Thermoplasmata archaeon]MCD6573725.1 NADH-quinone oxidoreductase subunit C [Thermoplasmata archaeon]